MVNQLVSSDLILAVIARLKLAERRVVVGSTMLCLSDGGSEGYWTMLSTFFAFFSTVFLLLARRRCQYSSQVLCFEESY